MPLVRPLYENQTFKSLLKKGRISGEIREIRENFDLKTHTGAFYELTGALDNIGLGNKPSSEIFMNGCMADSLVKQYVKR